MKECALFLLSIFLLTSVITQAKTIELQSRGIYKEINIQPQLDIIKILRQGNRQEKINAIKKVETNSDKYCPAVFFPLATDLFNQGKTKEALFWLYAGRIRTRYDIKRCTDHTVGGAITGLNWSTPRLLRMIQFEDLDSTKKIVKDAVEWDKKTPHNYDPRWIALHGMNSVNASFGQKGVNRELTIPEDEWKTLAEKNREEYLKGFLDQVKKITPEQLKQIKSNIEKMKNK